MMSGVPIERTSDECGICMNPFGGTTHTLGCKHSFCKRCLDPWVLKSQTCPACRATMEVIYVEFVGNDGLTAVTAIVIDEGDDY